MVLDKKSPYIRIQSGWFKKNKDKIIKEFEPLVEEGTTTLSFNLDCALFILEKRFAIGS